MVSLAQVENLIRTALPDAQVTVNDLGGGDHLEAIVVSPIFAGKSLVQQHQLVYGALKQEMATEAIHALALQTFTPEDWSASQGN
jgi:acid stress-induced BolA-like protein IbaG/YrbA